MTSLKPLINAAVFVNGSQVFVTPAASSGVTSHSSPLSDPEVLLVLVLPRCGSDSLFQAAARQRGGSSSKTVRSKSLSAPPHSDSVSAGTCGLCGTSPRAAGEEPRLHHAPRPAAGAGGGNLEQDR